jgi:hypothetical protein
VTHFATSIKIEGEPASLSLEAREADSAAQARVARQ